MPDYRIVFNERTVQYRIERRRLWGWSFVMDDQGRDYLTFADYQAACRHLCALRDRRGDTHRRWRVLEPCHCPNSLE